MPLLRTVSRGIFSFQRDSVGESAAAAAVVVIVSAAAAAAVVAEHEEQKDEDDDPPEAVAIVTAHNQTLLYSGSVCIAQSPENCVSNEKRFRFLVS